MRPRAVHVHIGELVLRGFQRSGRSEVATALERDLVRAIAAEVPSLLRHGGVHERVDGGRLTLGAGAPGRVVGEQVARAVYRGMAK